MSKNTIFLLILGLIIVLEMLATIMIFLHWSRFCKEEAKLRSILMSAVFILSALAPLVVVWLISFVGYCLNMGEPTWSLAESISDATGNVYSVYVLAMAGSSYLLWGTLLFFAIVGWIVNPFMCNRYIFLTSYLITVATFYFPPALLILRVIPYVGP